MHSQLAYIEREKLLSEFGFKFNRALESGNIQKIRQRQINMQTVLQLNTSLILIL